MIVSMYLVMKEGVKSGRNAAENQKELLKNESAWRLGLKNDWASLAESERRSEDPQKAAPGCWDK